jgi:hypothetical protein
MSGGAVGSLASSRAGSVIAPQTLVVSCALMACYVWRRRVIVDDLVPCDTSGRVMSAYSSNRNEFWVSIIEKAYIKVRHPPGPGLPYHAPVSTRCTAHCWCSNVGKAGDRAVWLRAGARRLRFSGLQLCTRRVLAYRWEARSHPHPVSAQSHSVPQFSCASALTSPRFYV